MTDPEQCSTVEALHWMRYPADAARAVLALVVWLLVTGWAAAEPVTVRGVVGRFVALVGSLPDSLTHPLIGSLQVAALLAPLAVLLLARRGRWRELGTALVAAATTAALGAATNSVVDESVPSAILDESQRPSWVTGSAFPSGTYLAAVAAAVTVVAPSLDRGWRRVLWGSVAFVGAVRVLTAVETPVGIVGLVAAGVFIGSVAMYALEVPLRSPAPEVVRRALIAAGLPVGRVAAASHLPRHGPTYLADDGDGASRWFVKLVGRDERNGELLARAVRALRVDGPDDRRTIGASETVAAEALALVLAARAGARVPDLVAVGATERGAGVVVMERVDGTALDELDDLDDATLASAFGQIARLHAARLAHGWASLHHLVRTDTGEVVLLDLRWATPAASDDALAIDLAELLASAAAAAGVERAVAAASGAFDADQLAAALPFLQPLVLSPETRARARHDKALLAQLREAVQGAAGVDGYEMADVARLTLRSLVTMAGTLVMGWVLLSLIGNAAEIWDALRDIDPTYLPVLLVISLLSFPAGAASLMGAVTVRLPFGRTTEVMFAQSFLNRFTPANAGGMALRTRYLQRNGVTLISAASAVAITSAASGVMQVVLAIGFFTAAGRSDEASTFTLPSGQVIAIAVVVVGVLLGVAYATTLGRRLLLQVWGSLRGALADIRALARQPAKVVLLFGGAGASKLFNILALAQTMRAFGVPMGLASVGAMYITATTVASAAPTPGGVGAIEAALTAGLVGLGVDVGVAAAVVLVFRLFTYWLPTIPSWFFLTRIQARGDA